MLPEVVEAIWEETEVILMETGIPYLLEEVEEVLWAIETIAMILNLIREEKMGEKMVSMK